MFQSTPTRGLSMVIDSTIDSWRRGTRGTTLQRLNLTQTYTVSRQGQSYGGLGTGMQIQGGPAEKRAGGWYDCLHPHPCSPDVVEFNPTLLQNQGKKTNPIQNPSKTLLVLSFTSNPPQPLALKLASQGPFCTKVEAADTAQPEA